MWHGLILIRIARSSAHIWLCGLGINGPMGWCPVVPPTALPTMPRAMAAAIDSWPPMLEMFRGLKYGLQPLLWTSLGLGPISQDHVVMMLARQQVKATARHHQLWQQYDRMVEDRGLDDEVEEDPMTEDLEMLLEIDSVYDGIVQRSELARHYGMVLCRAFFKCDTALEHLPPHVAVPDIVGMIEEFLNGHFVPCSE